MSNIRFYETPQKEKMIFTNYSDEIYKINDDTISIDNPVCFLEITKFNTDYAKKIAIVKTNLNFFYGIVKNLIEAFQKSYFYEFLKKYDEIKETVINNTSSHRLPVPAIGILIRGDDLDYLSNTTPYRFSIKNIHQIMYYTQSTYRTMRLSEEDLKDSLRKTKNISYKYIVDELLNMFRNFDTEYNTLITQYLHTLVYEFLEILQILLIKYHKALEITDFNKFYMKLGNINQTAQIYREGFMNDIIEMNGKNYSFDEYINTHKEFIENRIKVEHKNKMRAIIKAELD